MARGINAGTLNIEIVAEIAKLQQDMERVKKSVGDMSGSVSRSARAANDNLAAIGRGAGDGIRQFSKEVTALKAALDPAWAMMQKYRQEMAVANQALAQGAITGAQYVEAVRRAATAAGLLKDKQAAAALAAQQEAEALRAAALAAEEASRQQAAYAAQASALRAQIDPMFAAQQRFNTALDQSASLLRAGVITEREYAAAVTMAREALQDHARAVAGTAGQQTALRATTAAQKAGFQQLSYQIGDVATQLAMGAKPMQVFAAQAAQTTAAIGLMAGEAKGLIGFIGGPWGQIMIAAVTILGSLAAAYGGATDATKKKKDAAEELEKATESLYDSTVRETQSTWASINATIAQANANRQAAIEIRKRALAELEVQKSRLQASQVSRSIGDPYSDVGSAIVEPGLKNNISLLEASITKMNAAIKLSEGAIRLNQGKLIGLEVAAQFDKNAAASLKYDRALDHLNAQLLNGTINQAEYRKQMTAITATREAETAKTDKHRKTLTEAEKAAKKYQHYLADSMEMRAKFEIGIGKDAAAMAKGVDASAQMSAVLDDINEKQRIKADLAEAEIERQQRLLGIYLRQLDAIGQMGGAFGAIAGLLGGLATGNFGGVGGKAGAALNIIAQTKTGPVYDNQGRLIGDTIAARMQKLFDENGSFFKGMTKMLGNAGIGSATSSIFLGSSGSSLGGAIGGTLGGKFGEKFLSTGLESIAKGLGSFAGPIGSIAGGLLGGVIGGLFKTAKWGTAAVTGQNAGDVSTMGNKAAYTANANLAATSIQSGLQSIADQLGADVGGFNVSIGQYKGKWRVSSTGRTGKLGGRPLADVTDFGANGAEDAIKFAIADAIKDGALLGLRASTQRLLQQGTDVEKQLQKALDFEGVFNDLQSRIDPTGYALEQLTKKFDGLRKTFDEAGATTEEYAKLEQLLAMSRQDILDDASKQAIDDLATRNGMEVEILRLLGREEDAVAVSRLAELAGIKSSLRPLQSMIYQLQDARDVIAQFEPLSSGLKAFRDELLGGNTTNSFAYVAQQFRQTAGLAKMGDATALGSLKDVASQYLDAAKQNAATALDYQRAVGDVLSSVDQGIFAADAQIEYAQLQIDAVNHSADILQSMKDELGTYMRTLGSDTDYLRRLWDRIEGNGLTVKTDDDTPVKVEVV